MKTQAFPPEDQFASLLEWILEPESSISPVHADRIVPTGFANLDATIGGGLRAGQMSLVAGRAGVGTSMFALSVARAAALLHRIPTAFIAPDSSHAEILTRVIAAEAVTGISALRTGHPDAGVAMRVKRVAHRFENVPLMIHAEHTRSLDARDLYGTVQHATEARKARLVIIDGINHIEHETRELCRLLRPVMQGRKIAILATTKAVMPEERRAKQPQLRDIVQHAALEDHFDLVMTLNREDHHTDHSAYPGEASVQIVKHRYGPPRTQIALAFQGHLARFVDMERD